MEELQRSKKLRETAELVYNALWIHCYQSSSVAALQNKEGMLSPGSKSSAFALKSEAQGSTGMWECSLGN